MTKMNARTVKVLQETDALELEIQRALWAAEAAKAVEWLEGKYDEAEKLFNEFVDTVYLPGRPVGDLLRVFYARVTGWSCLVTTRRMVSLHWFLSNGVARRTDDTVFGGSALSRWPVPFESHSLDVPTDTWDEFDDNGVEITTVRSS